jgi:hypothetical protein
MSEESRTVFGTLNRLLKQPTATVVGIGQGEITSPFNFLAGALGCFAIYGLAAGFFQGDQQIVMAALKVPIIVFGTALLCLPSFYVFTSLAGSEFSISQTIRILAGFCAVLGLLMTGMISIAWLFSVSTKSILFVFWMHLIMWLAALVFARNYLRDAFPTTPQRRALRLWVFLFVLVSFQMVTHLRPILWRDSGEGFFTAGKMSFVEHFRSMNSAAFRQSSPHTVAATNH